MSVEVKIKGFKNKEYALAFIQWYEGQGEQWFYDYLLNTDREPIATNVDVTHTGNSGRYWDEDEKSITINLK